MASPCGSDDEPREAAFGGTSVVREAYRKVAIVQRRDPLLVTWAGPDEVFVQCFPIPAQGRECIRLSIAAPSLVLPRITEHNFGRSLEPVLALAPHQTLPPLRHRQRWRSLNYRHALPHPRPPRATGRGRRLRMDEAPIARRSMPPCKNGGSGCRCASGSRAAKTAGPSPSKAAPTTAPRSKRPSRRPRPIAGSCGSMARSPTSSAARQGSKRWPKDQQPAALAARYDVASATR